MPPAQSNLKVSWSLDHFGACVEGAVPVSCIYALAFAQALIEDVAPCGANFCKQACLISTIIGDLKPHLGTASNLDALVGMALKCLESCPSMS